jgi:glycosyltransferase involved in cell wall biosynthesis
MKIYLNNLNESWVVDRFRSEWEDYNEDITTQEIKNADVIWIFTPWLWKKISKKYLKTKKVLCSIYHIDFDKFSRKEFREFYKRDKFVDEYHVISQKTKTQLEKLTDKNIKSIPFWVNENIWFEIDNKVRLLKKYNLEEDKFYIGSFQRDTEGSDLKSPKLIKGPDQFVEIVKHFHEEKNNVLVILTGKRRQYVMLELEKAGIPYKYFEMVTFEELNELYNVLDLYIVSSRIEGGPQAIMECAITKTPIISTDVGIASEILSEKSIFDMSNFQKAKPDLEYAFQKTKKFNTSNGFMEFRTLLQDLYES